MSRNRVEESRRLGKVPSQWDSREMGQNGYLPPFLHGKSHTNCYETITHLHLSSLQESPSEPWNPRLSMGRCYTRQGFYFLSNQHCSFSLLAKYRSIPLIITRSLHRPSHRSIHSMTPPRVPLSLPSNTWRIHRSELAHVALKPSCTFRRLRTLQTYKYMSVSSWFLSQKSSLISWFTFSISSL